MAGFWLHPDTGQCVRVATTHDEWVRDRQNAEALGLPDDAYQQIISYPATAIDAIRLVAVRYGLVRIREHRRHVSVQYAAEHNREQAVLQAIATALTGLIHPDTRLVIDNLLLRESTAITLAELQADLKTREG